MANPEIFMPSESPGFQVEGIGTQDEKDTIVGLPHGEDRAAPGEKQETSETQEIEYLYLTFDTELPTPAGISSPKPDLPPPPECPNLKPFTSPFLWSKSRKTLITWLACGVTVLAAYSAGEYEPAAQQLIPIWGVSEVVFNLGVTIFCTGFAIAPMVLAPFSEINGRRPVFLASGILFTGMEKESPGLDVP
jgi:hypothetical protein